jgi:hypothetical protein
MEVCDVQGCVFAQYKPPTMFSGGELDIILVPRDREWFADKMLRYLLPFWQSVEKYYRDHGTRIDDLFKPDDAVAKRARTDDK